MKKSNLNLTYIMAIIAILIGGYLFIPGSTEVVETISLQSAASTIIPKPLSYEAKEGGFQIGSNTVIYVKGNNSNETEELYKIAEFFKEKIKPATGLDIKIVRGEPTNKGAIYLTTIGGNKDLGNEGYDIISTNESIEVKAYKPEGVSRAVQTLRQMLPADIEKNTKVENINWIIPAANISDKPEYDYRGLMIDVARHFFTVDEIKRQIDLAAQYKINKVHLHLSDDQGWRLEIKKYPELTNIGGKTEVGGGKGGYYTQEEFKDLVNYAKDRYVEIIPEFDMPGHINAALASYGFLNPDGKPKALYTGTKVGFSTLMTNDEKTYQFIDDLIKEVSAISPSKYIHIGGDEADNTNKADYDYFVGRVSKIAQKYGKTPIGWDPIDTSSNIDSTTVLQNWKDSNEEARKKNMKMVISIAKKAYLDFQYDENTPYGLNWGGYNSIENAYNWDPTDFAPKELVLGIEAPLWTETITDTKAMDYMIYPRLIGYSEIGWSPKASRSFREFKERLKAQGTRLENQGVNYYKDKSIWQ